MANTHLLQREKGEKVTTENQWRQKKQKSRTNKTKHIWKDKRASTQTDTWTATQTNKNIGKLKVRTFKKTQRRDNTK